jgi:hypothetical protein
VGGALGYGPVASGRPVRTAGSDPLLALKLCPRHVDNRSMRRLCGSSAVYGVLLALFASGCASGEAASREGAGAVVRVREKDFRIVVRPSRVRAGRVRLIVRNSGPADHEFVLTRASRMRLPLRADRLTVDEDRLEPVTVAMLEPGPPDTVRSVDVKLRKGTYVLFCNMAGHYMGGMRAFLIVS